MSLPFISKLGIQTPDKVSELPGGSAEATEGQSTVGPAETE